MRQQESISLSQPDVQAVILPPDSKVVVGCQMCVACKSPATGHMVS